MTENNPENFGWKLLGINPKTEREVYEQDGCQLTQLYSPGWFAQDREGQQYYLSDGTIQQVTAFLLTGEQAPKMVITPIHFQPTQENTIPSQARDLLEIIKRGLDSGRFVVVDGTIVLPSKEQEED